MRSAISEDYIWYRIGKEPVLFEEAIGRIVSTKWIGAMNDVLKLME